MSVEVPEASVGDLPDAVLAHIFQHAGKTER